MKRSQSSSGGSLLLKSAVAAGVFFAARAMVRRHRWFDLRNKVVLITGGSRGLGLEMSRRFAAQGARLAICARDDDELSRAKEDLRRTFPDVEVETFPASVSDEAQVAELIQLVVSMPAKLAVKFHALFPGITADISAVINRLLPGSGGIGEHRALGQDSESAAAPSFLTTLTEKAAVQNNEMGGRMRHTNQ